MASLTDTKIRALRSPEKPQRHSDGQGLYLLCHPAGGRWWRFRYRYHGRQKELSLGTYPEIGLKQARERRDQARKLLADGQDPAAVRKVEKGKDTFADLCREWHARNRNKWTPGTTALIWARLEKHALPWLGQQKPNDITAGEVLAVLRRLESRGALETAHKVRQYLSQAFRYGIASGQALRDPAADLKGALTPINAKHRAAMTEPAKVGDLLRALDGFEGTFAVACALRLLPLLLVRPGELRKAEWWEFDLEAATWKIPADKMKQRRPHLVPLPDQAVGILRELHPLTGAGRYVFPSIRTDQRPMSENTLNAALRRLGYDKHEVTPHGFRATASTLLHEQGFPSAWIELQLAHVDRNKVRAAYNHAEHLPERRKMLQAWADYLDGLRQGADVVPIHRHPLTNP